MKLKNIRNTEPLYDKEGVKGRSLTSNSNFEIIYMTLEPQAFLKPHKTPFDAEFFAHKGNAVFVIEGKEFYAEEGSIIACPGEVEHGIRNTSDKEIIVLVIKKF